MGGATSVSRAAALALLVLIPMAGARSLLDVLQAGQQLKGTALESALHFRPCGADILFQPANTDDIADVLHLLFNDRSSSGRKYLVRTSTHGFWTHNNFSCPTAHGEEAQGEAAAMTLLLDMSRMSQLLSLDTDASGYGTVTVQPGMTFEALTEQLLEHNLGLPGWLVAPPFAGMTLAEVIESASQGSSVHGPASIAAFLESAVLVDGTGEVQNLAQPGPLLEGSMGLLGAMTELTFQVVPARKVEVWEKVWEDVDMARDINQLLLREETMALEVVWNPSANGFTSRVWREAQPDNKGDYVNGLFVAEGAWLDKVGDLLSLDQEDQSGSQDYDIMCEVVGDLGAQQAFVPRHTSPQVHVPGQSRYRESLAAAGFTGRLGATRCVSHSDPSARPLEPASDAPSSPGCLWKRAKVTPHAFSIPASRLGEWVEDVGAVMRSTTACCNFLVHLRFVGKGESLMAPNWRVPAVSVTLLSLSSLKYGSQLPAKQQHLLDELLQRSMCAHGGQPHWALAENRLLLGSCGAHAALGSQRLARFAARMARFDPMHMFTHPLWDRIAQAAPATTYPGCTLAGDCFCEEDWHCSPGFRCVPGLAFPKFKACQMWGGQSVDARAYREEL